MGQVGAIPISRLAGNHPIMPADQGFIGTGGDEFRPWPMFVAGAPLLGFAVPSPPGIGLQWAPGQGGDTPGGGGASTAGQHVAVETALLKDGLVVPTSQIYPHRPGSVAPSGPRRSRA